MSQKKNDDSSRGSTQTLTRPQSKTKEPSMYQVILLNDDFTPMDFVTHVLTKFFNKSASEATRIMLDVHNKGAGQAGIYPYEVAETKVYQVNTYAKMNQHPLKSALEKI